MERDGTRPTTAGGEVRVRSKGRPNRRISGVSRGTRIDDGGARRVSVGKWTVNPRTGVHGSFVYSPTFSGPGNL